MNTFFIDYPGKFTQTNHNAVWIYSSLFLDSTQNYYVSYVHIWKKCCFFGIKIILIKQIINLICFCYTIEPTDLFPFIFFPPDKHIYLIFPLNNTHTYAPIEKPSLINNKSCFSPSKACFCNYRTLHPDYLRVLKMFDTHS